MIQTIEKKERLYSLAYSFALCLICAITIIPWAITYLNLAINVDIAFLSLSAQRLIEGERMSVSYYDTNPPLSILLYVPAALLTKLSTLPLYVTTHIYAVIALIIATLCTNSLLKKLPWTEEKHKRHLIITIYLLANTIFVNHDFGQKDHFLGMFLFPFAIAQIMLTQRLPFQGWSKWTTLSLGSITLLLKPHFGIIPICILLTRMMYQRRFWVIKDSDFISLAIAVLGYLLVIVIFFYDFISIIMPDVLQFYTDRINKEVISPTIKLGLFASVLIFIPHLMNRKDTSPSVFGIIGLICVIAAFTQGKGFPYHYIPAQTFLSCAAACFLHDLLTHNNIYKIHKKISTLIVLLLMAFSINQFAIHLNKRPTHSTYKNLELTKILNDCKSENKDGCSFFMFHDISNLIHELSIYADQPHASRFPVLWFMPYLINNANNTGKHKSDADKFESYKNKYLTYTLQDFKKYKPDTLVIVESYFATNTSFDFIEFTQTHSPSFIDIWADYEYTKTINIDMNRYIGVHLPRNTAKVDIYKRRNK